MTISSWSAATTRASTSASSTVGQMSMGDFVLTGGEIPLWQWQTRCAAWSPASCRTQSAQEEESHWNGLLEYPQYSRPALWHDRPVPRRSYCPGTTARWPPGQKESSGATMRRRPDLFAQFDSSQLTTKAERKILREAQEELAAEDSARKWLSFSGANFKTVALATG